MRPSLWGKGEGIKSEGLTPLGITVTSLQLSPSEAM